MMCLLKKNAVIFKVGNDVKDQDPIVVIEQKIYTNEEPDSCVPLLGIYDGTHYQSVFPASKKDEELTVQIVKYFPEFQGDFKAFFKDKITQKYGLNSSHDGHVSDIDGQEYVSEPENYKMDSQESLSELENYKMDGQESVSEPENYKMDGQESVSEPENYKMDGQESVSEPENYEMDGKNSSYKETVSELANFEIDGRNIPSEGNSSNQNESKIEENFEFVDDKKEILSEFEEEAMLFITMQEKKHEKKVRQRIRAQVITQ